MVLIVTELNFGLLLVYDGITYYHCCSALMGRLEIQLDLVHKSGYIAQVKYIASQSQPRIINPILKIKNWSIVEASHFSERKYTLALYKRCDSISILVLFR